MPIQTDAPINTGALHDWGLWGSAPDKIAAVATNDGDTSVIFAVSGGRLCREAMQFPTLAGVADPVTAASVTAVIRKYANGVGGQSLYFNWNSIRVGANQWSSVGGSIYHTLTYNAAGAGLALAVVNGEHGMDFSAAGGPSAKAEVWMTQLYRTVSFTYTAGDAGEFAYMIGSLVGAFIGGNLLFREMPALARFLWRRTGYLIKPSEYEIAFRAWKEA